MLASAIVMEVQQYITENSAFRDETGKRLAVRTSFAFSLDTIQPAHWQEMAKEARPGWPPVRETQRGRKWQFRATSSECSHSPSISAGSSPSAAQRAAASPAAWPVAIMLPVTR